MNVLGPLARSVDDLSLLMKILAGPCVEEPDVPPVPWLEAAPRPLDTYRIAWSTSFGGIPVTRETKEAIAKLAAELARAGCAVEERNPEGFDFEAAWETWGEIAITERAATGRERSAERVAALNATLGEQWAVARGSARGVKAGVSEYAVALQRRDALIAILEKFFDRWEFFDRWDAFLCPVTVSPAIPHVPFGTPIEVDGHKVPYFIAGTAYTCPFNLTGHPAVVLPLTRSKEGLPIGVQVLGRRWSEPGLLALCEQLALITGPFTPPPGFQA
jgi:amidase